MVSKINPFRNVIIKDHNYRLFHRKNKTFWNSVEASVKTKFSEKFKDLINKMLSFNPKKRLTISRIKNHPWLENKWKR